MTSPTDLCTELVAYDRGELDAAESARVEQALAASPELRSELAEIRSVLALVRSVGDLQASTGARARLNAAVDDELLRNPVHAASADVAAAADVAPGDGDLAPIHDLGSFRGRVAGAWAFAQWRYENSRGVRRFVAASIVVHVAALVSLAFLFVHEVRSRPVDVAVHFPDDPDVLDADDPYVIPDELLAPRDTEVVDLADPTALPPFDFPRSGTGVPFTPPITAAAQPVGRDMRFPTVGVMIRFRAVFDEQERARQIERNAGELGPWVTQSVDRGLAWLREKQLPDGSWGPSADAPDEIRNGVTAATVLAFTSDGRSAVEGADAAVLGPATKRLETWLGADVTAAAAGRAAQKPLYAYALSVQALAQQYGLDYRHLSDSERSARRTLLREAGHRLLSWQSESGGYGYLPGAESPDASCTLFAVAALSELRVAGVMETADAMNRAGQFLSSTRDAGTGRQDYQQAGDRVGDLALTAGRLAYARELGLEPDAASRNALDAVQAHIRDLGQSDALLVLAGSSALRRHQRTLVGPLEALKRQQSGDGSWTASTDRHIRQGGDAFATALGVLSLTRTYVAN